MKTKMKILFLYLVLLVFSSCSTFYVAVDYDKLNDFSRYKKYKWIKQKTKEDDKSIYKNGINRKRFANTIENVLNEKGFLRTEDDDYEFSVVYHLRFEKKLDVSSYGYKYYPGLGYTERYIQTKVYQEGSVILDIIDRNEKILVWRGVAEGVLLETDDPEYVIDGTIKSILSKFPPK